MFSLGIATKLKVVCGYNMIFILSIEWIMLFIFFPLLIFSEWLEINRHIIILHTVLYVLWHERYNLLSSPLPSTPILNWQWLWGRIILIVSMLFIMAYLVLKDKFLLLPRTRPALWLMIMLLYPMLSALPQEIVYRQFYFRRYAVLWPDSNLLIATNVFCFVLLHLMYDNWIAVGFSLIGGIIFARAYQQTQSLYWLWLEHSIYGLAIFTSGWGQFFYESN